jgi:ribosomal peptide maturation radical SAM protein 1
MRESGDSWPAEPVLSADSGTPDTTMATTVALITMPFGPLTLPSIGLTLLKNILAGHGVASKIHYLTIPYSRMIGPAVYARVANGKPTVSHLIGEWIFSAALFDQSEDQERAYVSQLLRGGVNPGTPEDEQRFIESEEFIQAVLSARAALPGFLDYCVGIIMPDKPRIVGFTSVFQQQLASLALAKRIKEHHSDLITVFGGANCEGMMGAEIVRQFDFVDAVVSGEGEIAFPELVARVLGNRNFDDIPGVFTIRNPSIAAASRNPPQNAPSIRNLDDLPYVGYHDFFEQAEYLEEQTKERLQLLFETSRGCWWGQKQHCTFCGLNGVSMSFRSKSAERALSELKQLCADHPGRQVQIVDNILDMRYFNDFLPALAVEHLDADLFYEVKANLKKEHLNALVRAGIRSIQPGIESLSTAVLARMRKGVTAIQNVQLLKWCKELGIQPAWNVLWGFPGEDPEDYHKMTELVGKLVHLPPPLAAGPLRVDRFSPLFDQAVSLGLTDVGPVPAYQHIYPGLPAEAVYNLAYYFGYSCPRVQPVAVYIADLRRALSDWRRNYLTSDLISIDKGDYLVVWDLRRDSRTPLTVITGSACTLYRECDAYHSCQHLAHVLNGAGGHPEVSETDLHEIMRPLLERDLVMREGNCYLSLAVPLGPYKPSLRVRQRLEDVASELGMRDGRGYEIPAVQVRAAII